MQTRLILVIWSGFEKKKFKKIRLIESNYETVEWAFASDALSFRR